MRREEPRSGGPSILATEPDERSSIACSLFLRSCTSQYKVQVYLYDLSQGMAKALSMGFLGKQIDGIWHTGLVVYGSEYYYGGGIQASRPGGSMAGQPQTVIDIGYTRVAPETFHTFLSGVSHRFTAATYSLLSHNCNNFTNEACLFLTGKPIPSYITGLPEEALATPFGAMLRPMIAQMEGNMRGGGAGMVPWGADTLDLPRYFSHPDRMAPAESQEHAAISGAAAIAAAAINQSTPSNAAPAVATPSTGAVSSSSSSTSNPNLLSLLNRTSPSKLLTSSDTKAKSFQILLKANAKKLPASPTGLSKEEDAILTAMVNALSDSATPVQPAGVALLESTLSWPAALQFPGLGLMRLLVLRPECKDHFAASGVALAEKLRGFLPTEDESSSAAAAADKVAPPNAQAMALCTLSNLLTHPSIGSQLAASPTIWSAVRSTGRSENLTVRLMSATLAFNAVVLLPVRSEESDTVVEALTYLSESVKTEHAVDVATRLLLALGEIISLGAASHGELLVGLEFSESLPGLRAKFPEAPQAQQTLREIEGLLSKASQEAFAVA
jgi:hypothetical protein